MYFNLHESHRKSEDQLIEMFNDLGFSPPSDPEVLSFMTRPGPYYPLATVNTAHITASHIMIDPCMQAGLR